MTRKRSVRDWRIKQEEPGRLTRPANAIFAPQRTPLRHILCVTPGIAKFQHPRRIAAHHRQRRHIPRHHTAHRHHGPLADRHTAAHDHISAQPHIVVDHDGATDARLVIGQAVTLVAMVDAPQHAMVGDHHIVTDGHPAIGHDLGMAADMDVIAQYQVLLTIYETRLLDANIMA